MASPNKDQCHATCSVINITQFISICIDLSKQIRVFYRKIQALFLFEGHLLLLEVTDVGCWDVSKKGTPHMFYCIVIWAICRTVVNETKLAVAQKLQQSVEDQGLDSSALQSACQCPRARCRTLNDPRRLSRRCVWVCLWMVTSWAGGTWDGRNTAM